MEPRQIFRSGITASAIVHLSCLLLVIFFTEVHPFGAVTAEPIAVDIVAPDEVAEKPAEPPTVPKQEEKKKPPDSFDLSSKPDSSTETPSSPPPAAAAAAAPPPAAAKPAQAAAPQKQAALSQPKPVPTPTPAPSAAPASTQPPAQQPAQQSAQQPVAQQPTPQPAPVAQPSYASAQPDLTVKYHVMLGLPQSRPGDGFDAPATEKADVATDSIGEFRRHLKTCSTLPKSVAATDKVAIKLRVLMTPDGRLAAEPMLIEASASMKGPLLMQSAISALQACQPYDMLPADKYREWRSLDLSFTPQDFAGAS